MTSCAKAIRISDHVYWVGATDWRIRDFHGYATHRGSTYNAFLILGEKITLIDTVKEMFFPEMMDRIASVIDPKKIDYIVSNHAEMDHSGALPKTIEACQPEKIFASVMGAKALADHFGPLAITPVKSGDTLSLGNLNLTFVETRMLHWPDSMITYLAEEQILFTQDGFGMHLATDRMFSDEIAPDVIRFEAEKYFANILLPYAPQVIKLLDALPGLNLPVKIIAPDHGPLHRGEWIGRTLDWYREFALQKPTRKAIITYATMWGSTDKMATAIGEGLRESGVELKVLPLAGSDRSDVITEILHSGALIVGSPTLNNSMFPTVADMLCYTKGLRPKNLVGGAFGSFGWSGEASNLVSEQMQSFGVEMVGTPLTQKYVPTAETLQRCNEYGKAIAVALDALIARTE